MPVTAGSVDLRFLAASGGVPAAVAWACRLHPRSEPALLDRMMIALHTLAPDALQEVDEFQSTALEIRGREQETQRRDRMNSTRRGASTERQYMVYFRSTTSCMRATVGRNDDGTLYDPELMYEVAQA